MSWAEKNMKRRKAAKKQKWVIDGLIDNKDFNAFILENMANEEFKRFGKEHGIALVKDLWYHTRFTEERKDLHEISQEEAIRIINEAVPRNILEGWFRDANSDYKPKLLDAIASHGGVLNAGLNMAYHNYRTLLEDGKKPLSFSVWLRTPVTLYRGEYGQKSTKGDVFMSYTPSRATAEQFAGPNGTVKTIQISPIETWGAYTTNAEDEYLVPYNRRR